MSDNNKETQLKAKLTEEEIIAGYKMKEGDYRIIIKLLEANDLMPIDSAQNSLFGNKKGTVNPLVKMEVCGKTVYSRKIKQKTSNPIFNQQFFFDLKDMKQHQLENSIINFVVIDYSPLKDYIIGSYEMDLSVAYFQLNHEVYQGWLTLTDPTDEREGIMGYLKVSISVCGPGDEPVVHDIKQEKMGQAKEKSFFSQKVKVVGHLVSVDIYRAEHLAPFDSLSNNSDAYIQLKYSGIKAKIGRISSINPEWNQNVHLATNLPNVSKYLSFEVFNYHYTDDDELIGQFKVKFKDIQEKDLAPMWGNLYGPPLSHRTKGDQNQGQLMALYGDKQGSHYRGRVLYKITSWPEKDPQTKVKKLNFKFPYNPIPTCAQKNYLLRVNILQCNEVPERERCIIHVALGPYLLKTEEVKIDQGRAIIFQQLQDKKCLLPVNHAEIPDLIIYFADKNEEFRRHSFVRIPAKDIIIDENVYNNKQNLKKITKARNIKLKEDRSLNLISDEEIAGFVYASIQLWQVSPDPVIKITEKDIRYQNYILRVNIYVGRNFAPKDESGTSDPFVMIRCAGKTAYSKCLKETLNPGWYQTLELRVKLPEFEEGKDQIIEPGYSLALYDSDEVDNPETYKIQRELIGRTWIQIYNNFAFFKFIDTKTKQNKEEYIDFIYNKPKWYNIVYEPTEELQGKVLVGCALFKQDDEQNASDQVLKISKIEDKIPKVDANIKPSCDKRKLHMYCIGLRDIMEDVGEFKPKVLYVKFDISIDNFEGKQTVKQKIKNGGISLNQEIEVEIDVPRNKKLHPVLEIQVWDQPINGRKKQLLGIGTIEFTDHLQKYLEEQDLEGSQEDEDLDKLVNDIQIEINGEQKKKNISKNEFRSIKNNKNDFEINVPWEIPKKKLIVDQQQYDQQRNNVILDDEEDDDDDDEENQNLNEINEEQVEDQQQQDPEKESYQSLDHLIENFNFQDEDEKINLLSDQKAQNYKEQHQGVGKSNLYNLNNQIPAKQNIDDSQDLNNQTINNNNYNSPQRDNQNADLNIFTKNNLAFKKDNQQNGQIELESLNLEENNDIGSKLVKMNNQTNNNSQKINSPEQMGQLVESKMIIQQQQQNNKEQLNQQTPETQEQLQENKEKEKEKDWYQYKDHKKVYENFQILSKNSISFEQEPSDHAIPYENNVNVETISGKRLRIKQELQKGKGAKNLFSLGLASLTSKIKKQKKTEIETYEDYDTDPNENLDITQEFLIDRPVFNTDIEKQFDKQNTIRRFPIKRGLVRGNKNIFQLDKITEIVEVTNLKCIFLKDAKPKEIEKRYQLIRKLMKEKEFIVRLYILRGRNIIGTSESDPDCYLKVKLGEKEINDEQRSLRKAQLNPYFYTDYEFTTFLPGNSYLKIEVWDKNEFDADTMIGYTNIDLEERFFQSKWKQLDKKPLENRNLQQQSGSISSGHLEMWIDIILKSKIRQFPKIKIEPPPYDEYELRCIVWSTTDLVYKDALEKCNDVFCTGAVGNQEFLETDVHWRCRAKGSFNWRWKYKVNYPMREDDYGNGMDRFKIQVWDKDIIGSNELIGETEIDLNLHKMIDKAVKRKKPVQMFRRVLEKGGLISDKFWFDLYSPQAVDANGKKISQGKVQLSFEIMPKDEAEKKQNGLGRDSPNNFPPLPAPTGRFQFNLLDPIGMVKELLGPELYQKFCRFCLLGGCFIIFVFLIIMVLPNIIAVKIAGA